jgi:hypothetical protein
MNISPFTSVTNSLHMFHVEHRYSYVEEGHSKLIGMFHVEHTNYVPPSM